jgi:hypothetical protein
MTTWHELYILNKSSGQKLFRSSVSDMALPGAIRELERHYNNIKSESVDYGFTDINVVMLVDGHEHIPACELPVMSEDDLLAELLG